MLGLRIIAALVFMMLLLFIYLAILGNKRQLEEISKRMAAIDEKMSSLQQQVDKTGTGPRTSVPQPIDQSRWLNRGKPFPLTQDPYFQSLPQVLNRNQTILYRISSSEKGFNRVLENSAQIGEWHDYYVNDWLAQRQWEDFERWSPHLAERIEISEDAREFTIYLRKGVKWHKPQVNFSDANFDWLKGDHFVTSHDFYFAYTTIIDPKVMAAHFRPYYQDIQSFEIIDDYIFIIRWKKALYTNIPYTLEQFPVAKFLFSKDKNGNEFSSETFGLEFNRHWHNDRMLGCGPYMFAEQKPDEYVELVRNEEYYGYRPALQRLRFTIVRDDNTAYLKLKGNELNMIFLLQENIYRDDIHRGGTDSPFKRGKLVEQVYPRMVYYHIKWNNTHPIFRDKMVRRAMTYAFDREAILKNVCMGLGLVTAGEISPLSPYYNKKIKPYPYDLKAARKMLEEQGWRDEEGDGILEKVIDGQRRKFEFVLYYASGYDVFKQMYEIYRDDLLKIGVKMTTQAIDWPVFQKKSEDKDFEAMNGVWGTGVPLDFYQIWHSKGADEPKSSNQIRFKNEEVDDICQKMREATEPEERVKLAYRMQEIWHEEQPYTFLFFRSGVAAYTSNIQNRFIRQLRPHTLMHSYYMETK